MKSKFKKGDRIKIRQHVPGAWLEGEIVGRHWNRQMIVIRLDGGSLRTWPRHRVYKI